MSTDFVVVPQWQGSGSSRAMRLVDGAEAIRGDLPSASTVLVAVPSGAGSSQETGVQRVSALVQVREATLAALDGLSGFPLVIGGDCGVELAAIGHAATRNDSLAVVWLDAHADLNTAETSPSGAFHGMVLRTLLGDGISELLPPVPLVPERVILGGTRALDEPEADYLATTGIRSLGAEGLTAQAITEALVESGATSVYLHIDLDVLDPAEFDGLGYPEPFGVTLPALLGVIAAVKAALPLVGAGITEFAPSSPDAAGDDLSSILRVIGAVTA